MDDRARRQRRIASDLPQADPQPWGGPEEGGLPPIEDLTGTTGRGPAEAFGAMRDELGLEQSQHHHDGGPDVSGWRDELGLG
jgi:hypothetical protein